jgi:ribosomal-protein-alanine N-acetyltransferase
MRAADVDRVMAIEAVSFPSPWSRVTYLTELARESLTFYIVAEWEGELVGYAGYWLIPDEAHITTIAVHPGHRRRGIAEHMVVHLLQTARAAGATRATLEYRVSNYGAAKLYDKYGFRREGLRRGYYRDGNEDAVVANLRGLDTPAYARRLEQLKRALEQRLPASCE